MKEQDRNLEAMSSYDINARLRPLLTLSFLQSFSWGITAPLISIAMTQYYATQNQLPGEHIDCFHHATDRACVEGSKIASWYSSVLSALVCLLKLVMSPMFGVASDCIGRKPFIVLNQFLQLPYPFTLMVFIIKSGPIWPYFIFQLISDGFQIISIGSASIADFVPPQDRARAFGLNMAFMLVGYSLSSLVEIRLSKYHVLTLSAILHVFRWLFSLFFIFETLPSSARKQSFRWSQCLNPLRSFSILNRTSSYRKLTGLIGLVSFAASGMRQIQPFYLNTTANFTDSDIARHFLIYGVSCILAQTCCLPTLMRFCGQEKGVVIISFFFYIIPCLTYVLLVWYPYKWIVFATDGFSGIQVLSHTAITSLFSTSSALQEQGRLQGAIVGVGAVFQAMGPLIYAFMYSRMRVQLVWTRILPFILSIVFYSMAISVACFLPNVKWLAVHQKTTASHQSASKSFDTPDVDDMVEPLLSNENSCDVEQ